MNHIKLFYTFITFNFMIMIKFLIFLKVYKYLAHVIILVSRNIYLLEVIVLISLFLARIISQIQNIIRIMNGFMYTL